MDLMAIVSRTQQLCLGIEGSGRRGSRSPCTPRFRALVAASEIATPDKACLRDKSESNYNANLIADEPNYA